MKDWTKIAFICFVCSCSSGNLEPDITYSLAREEELFDRNIENHEDFVEYTAWLKSEESNHFEKKELGLFEFSALLEPSFYSYVKNEGLDKLNAYDANHFDEQIRIEYSIVVPSLNGELIRANIKDRAEYNERISYYSFQFYKDTYLIVDQDSIPCGMSVWERQFNASPSIKMQLLFPISQEQIKGKKLQLVYYDRVFNNGLIKMNF